MNHPTRRQFLVSTSAAVGAPMLTACGGGSSSSEPVVEAVADVSDAAGVDAASSHKIFAPTSKSTPIVQPPATGVLGTSIGAMQFTLLSSVASSAAPFCVGHAFKQGDVPAGSTLKVDSGTLQVTPKNTWNDGSLKFAIVAGQVALPAGRAVVVPLRKMSGSATGAALTTFALKSTDITVQIACGAFGTAGWATTDWDAPFMTWVSGPVMSSWIYRKPVGKDPHLVAWLEVRLFASGAVEVLPWIENGYIRVPGPTNKNATYTFSLGGTQRFSAAIDLKHHQRTPLISGKALSYWLEADPGVTVRHDAQYFQATELVPSYSAQVSPTAAVVTALAASYVPLQAGNITYQDDSMPGAGYQEPIGLLPQHDVLYLVSDVAQAYAAVVRNGFSAGRYSIHYRDESTLRPLRFSAYPTLNIGDGQGFRDTGASTTSSYTPMPTGGNAPTWDVAHSPSVGYMAYLITGRFYFMEEVQFATTANYLGNGDNDFLRTGSKGLVQTSTDAWQTRSCAWDWRARVQALAVTPDDDTALRAEFIASVEANIDHFHGRYVAQQNNPYGWIAPGESGYDGTTALGAPWQQDFVTAAFGYSLGLGLPLSATAVTRLAAFFQWKAKSVVSRLGPRGAFWYINAAPYMVRISAAKYPDYVRGTGPWFATDAEVYAATYASSPSWLGNTDGVLAGEIMPGDRAQWGNLMPAIAYAVRYGVPGAQASYARITGASNYKALADSFNGAPVWSVRPSRITASTSSTAAPAWLAGKPANTWIEIPNTAGAGGAAVDAYCGIAFDERSNSIVIAAAGGHWDSSDNRVVSLALAADAPKWVQRKAPSPQALVNVDHYADGLPAARHTYHSSHVVESLDRVFLFGCRFAYGVAYEFPTVDAFNLSTNQWDPAGTWAPIPAGGGYGAVRVRGSDDVYTTSLAKWSATTRSWSSPITTRTPDPLRWPIAHDSLRNQLFTLEWADGQGYGDAKVFASRVPLAGSAQISVTFAPGAALSQFIAEAPAYAGMDYDAVNDCFLFYSGQGGGAGRIYVIKPNDTNVWAMSILPLASGSPLPVANSGSGVYSRFRYVPALKGCLLLADAAANLYFIRTS